MAVLGATCDETMKRECVVDDLAVQIAEGVADRLQVVAVVACAVSPTWLVYPSDLPPSP